MGWYVLISRLYGTDQEELQGIFKNCALWHLAFRIEEFERTVCTAADRGNN
jgi:hypothetical protein